MGVYQGQEKILAITHNYHYVATWGTHCAGPRLCCSTLCIHLVLIMYILGISAFYHDSGVALIKDEEIIAAAQEERFTRIKHDAGFPVLAIKYCLEEAKISLSDVDHIAFYDKPFLKFERLLETYLTEAPKGLSSFILAIPLWLKEKLFLKETLIRSFCEIEGLEKKRNREKINVWRTSSKPRC